MPKLLSRSKHEEFESNLAFQIINQEERIAENRGNWSTCEHYASCALCILRTVPPAACSPAFHASVFLLHFFVSSYFNPCNKFRSWFLLYFPLTLSIYQPQFVHNSLHVGNRRAAVSPLLPFLLFFHFLFHFLGCQTPFDDDKSKDGWVEHFLLEEEGYWATVLRYTFGSPIFHAADFGILVPKFATLGLKLFDVLSLANTWQAFRVQCILSFRYTDIH